MRITEYDLELNGDKHPVLVKERAVNYPSESRALSSPQKIAQMCNDIFRMDKLAEENVLLIAVDTKCFPLGVCRISKGTVSQSYANPREIFIRLLLLGATGFMVVHNHPSGDTVPSKSDIDVFTKLKSTGDVIGVQMLDFIIIGDGYLSFHGDGMFCDPENR